MMSEARFQCLPGNLQCLHVDGLVMDSVVLTLTISILIG